MTKTRFFIPGIWIENGILLIVLNKRKHRPEGSVPCTECECGKVAVCVKCLVEKHIGTKKPGEVFYGFWGTAISSETKKALEPTGRMAGQHH